MRAAMRAVALAVSVGLVGGAAFATPMKGAPESGPARLVEPVQYWGSSYCERLRRACVYKEYRGEVGEGNCRRYRNECLSRNDHCERLRRACVYKEHRGEVGEGNCRRYRRQCGWD